MSVLAPPPLFTRENTNLLAPLGDGWEWTTKVSCRPWRVLIFNLRLSDFCATPDSLADLAFADQFGNPIPNAGDLGAARRPSERARDTVSISSCERIGISVGVVRSARGALCSSGAAFCWATPCSGT